ncbi:MAG: hypothetical protein AAF628_27365 [Planctomycetota bacterium]
MKASVLCAAALLVASCNYSNPHGSQDLQPVRRLITEPRGAQVTIESLGLQLEAPCDLPEDVRMDDALRIVKPGFHPWEGTLLDLPQPAMGTYRVMLRER